ncbi:hypothetical protein BC834DRAFT_871501 [Gloeopeniophorella convolvens]|nr:hypothetical protein BC834DRAFT_871501 [Gloeopeniophorella convolvens]
MGRYGAVELLPECTPPDSTFCIPSFKALTWPRSPRDCLDSIVSVPCFVSFVLVTFNRLNFPRARDLSHIYASSSLYLLHAIIFSGSFLLWRYQLRINVVLMIPFFLINLRCVVL